MKNETKNGITRRSFIKRSTVAAIAATNLMMFTGMVNATGTHPSPKDLLVVKPCKITKVPGQVQYPDGSMADIFECTADRACSSEVSCGDMYELDNNGNPKKVDGVKVKKAVKWNCNEKIEWKDDNGKVIKVTAKSVLCLQ